METKTDWQPQLQGTGMLLKMLTALLAVNIQTAYNMAECCSAYLLHQSIIKEAHNIEIVLETHIEES